MGEKVNSWSRKSTLIEKLNGELKKCDCDLKKVALEIFDKVGLIFLDSDLKKVPSLKSQNPKSNHSTSLYILNIKNLTFEIFLIN